MRVSDASLAGTVCRASKRFCASSRATAQMRQRSQWLLDVGVVVGAEDVVGNRRPRGR